jgi:hypothetical protein
VPVQGVSRDGVRSAPFATASIRGGDAARTGCDRRGASRSASPPARSVRAIVRDMLKHLCSAISYAVQRALHDSVNASRRIQRAI